MYLIRQVIVPVLVLVTLSLTDRRVQGELPSFCLTSISTSNSQLCCITEPFLEISFQLKFGCDIPKYLDQGVRLEISSSNGTNNEWIPIRFYTPTLELFNLSLVTHNANESFVTAEALTYSSTFPFEIIHGSEMIHVREYICDQSILRGNISIRWMQRYRQVSMEGVATWSLDNVTVTYWNGQCRQEVIQDSFDEDIMFETYDVVAGTVQTTDCSESGNSVLYFSEELTRRFSSRRSLTMEQLSVDTLPDCHQADGTGQCMADGCGVENTICSVGRIECTDCQVSGYQRPTDTDVGVCVDVDECALETDECEQICVNTHGSYLCNCTEGYSLLPDTLSCADIDECERNPCNHTCTNTNGSFECGCSEGYALADDGFKCLDINECTQVPVCDQLCENVEGSFQCSCLEGYTLASDNTSCHDIDECNQQDICEQKCINTNGSFYCTCFPGYRQLPDVSSCEDIDECIAPYQNVCDRIREECNNTVGSYVCQCREGFTLSADGVTCQLDLQQAISALASLQASLNNDLSTNDTVEFARVLADLVSDLIAAGVVATRNLSTTFSNAVDDLLASLDTNGGTDNAAQMAVSSILSTLDLFALRVYDSSEPTLETSGFQLRVTNVSNATGRIEGISQGSNSISLPSVGNGVKIASFHFKDLANALPLNPNKDTLDISMEKVPVISSSVLCDDCDVTNLDEPVRYELMFEEIDETNPECYFYNLSIHNWSTNGCQYIAESGVCECNHLTHFAILLSPGLNLTMEEQFGLQVVGYVGVSISLFCLLVTIFMLSFVKSLWGMRNFIHINLCVSLFVAQLVFVTSVDKVYNEVLCQSIAVVLHYLFLVTFMWMLMEGVVLYVVLVKVFVKNQRLYMVAFALISYGVPLVYLFLTVPLGFAVRDASGNPHYGSTSDREGCWLRYSTGFIWAFIAPVILIILINIGFFVMAVYIMRKHSKRHAKTSHIGTLSQWLKSSITLLITMGIPWIIGVLIFSEKLLFLAYIYTIFIAFQGLIIFILFVPLSKQVREGYKKWWKVKVSESDFLSKHFSSSDIDKKSSFLGRLSSMRTSTFRMSRLDRSTFRSSHAEDHDIKIPSSPAKKDLSASPPPTTEKYMVESQIVVSVGNGTAVSDPKKGPDLSNGTLEVHDTGEATYSKSDLEQGLTMFEEQTMRFSESVSDLPVPEPKEEGTNL